MDRLVTLFGGGGFIGRYVAQQLYKAGVRVRIAQRNPRQAFFLKPLGGLGQTQFVRADIRSRDEVAAAVRGSWAVINMVGILKGDFFPVHGDGARHIAEAAAASDVQALVQLSAIGADPASPSAYGRSKAEGEAQARAAFPPATILRPSVVFGQEDHFVNRFAAMARLLPVLPVIRPQTRLQPIWVGDVARAAAAAALDPMAHAAKTYELGGPQILTMRQFHERICRETAHQRPIVEVPDAAAALIARFGWLPGAPITWDQWLMLQRDNVVGEGDNGLRAFGLVPTPLAAVSDGWLTTYRRHGRFAEVKSPY